MFLSYSNQKFYRLLSLGHCASKEVFCLFACLCIFHSGNVVCDSLVALLESLYHMYFPATLFDSSSLMDFFSVTCMSLPLSMQFCNTLVAEGRLRDLPYHFGQSSTACY